MRENCECYFCGFGVVVFAVDAVERSDVVVFAVGAVERSNVVVFAVDAVERIDVAVLEVPLSRQEMPKRRKTFN